MAAIALAESGGNPTAVNPNDNNGTQSSYGLWQISNGTHQPPASNWASPQVNAELAVRKFETQGLGAWGTYTSGAYKNFSSAANSMIPVSSATLASSNTSSGSSATNQLDLNGLTPTEAFLAYLQNAFDPSFGSVGFSIFSLNFSSLAGMLVRGLTVVSGLVLIYMGVNRVSSGGSSNGGFTVNRIMNYSLENRKLAQRERERQSLDLREATEASRAVYREQARQAREAAAREAREQAARKRQSRQSKGGRNLPSIIEEL